jgi:hypothetical protein
LLVQGPQPAAADAVAVRGDAELSPAAAFASARDRMAEHVRGVWAQRAARLSASERPLWLPAAIVDASVHRWLAALPLDEFARVVDREDRARDHGFGQSHQTTLWVSEEPDAQRRGERQLRDVLSAAARDVGLRGGAVACAWATIALAVGWFDRLSRGYMTGRLRLLGVLLGVAVPAIAVVV